jgi:hypothetical protein
MEPRRSDNDLSGSGISWLSVVLADWRAFARAPFLQFSGDGF